MISIPGYDSWKLASPYDDENEWTDRIKVECDFELDENDKHYCGIDCSPDQNFHICGFIGTVEASFVGDEDEHTYYWQCPECGNDLEGTN